MNKTKELFNTYGLALDETDEQSGTAVMASLSSERMDFLLENKQMGFTDQEEKDELTQDFFEKTNWKIIDHPFWEKQGIATGEIFWKFPEKMKTIYLLGSCELDDTNFGYSGYLIEPLIVGGDGEMRNDLLEMAFVLNPRLKLETLFMDRSERCYKIWEFYKDAYRNTCDQLDGKVYLFKELIEKIPLTLLEDYETSLANNEKSNEVLE